MEEAEKKERNWRGRRLCGGERHRSGRCRSHEKGGRMGFGLTGWVGF